MNLKRTNEITWKVEDLVVENDEAREASDAQLNHSPDDAEAEVAMNHS